MVQGWRVQVELAIYGSWQMKIWEGIWLNPIRSMFDRMGCRIPVLNGGHGKSGCLGQTKNRWEKVKMPEMVPEKWSQEVAIEVGGRNDGRVMGKICQPPSPINAPKKCPPSGPGKKWPANSEPWWGGCWQASEWSSPKKCGRHDKKSRPWRPKLELHQHPKKSVELPSGKVGWKWRP